MSRMNWQKLVSSSTCRMRCIRPGGGSQISRSWLFNEGRIVHVRRSTSTCYRNVVLIVRGNAGFLDYEQSASPPTFNWMCSAIPGHNSTYDISGFDTVTLLLI